MSSNDMFSIKHVIQSSTMRWSHLFLLVQHDVGFEARHSGEFLMAHRTGGVGGRVRGLVKGEVELHIERLWALAASMRL